MTIPNDKFNSTITPYQLELFSAFDSRRVYLQESQIFMCEWHRRARKTSGAINLLIKEACRTDKCKYGYIAPTQVQARNIVWDDPNMLKAYLPEQAELGWKANEQKMLITFDNQSQIKICGSDDPDAIRGMDFTGVAVDEAALVKKQLYTEIIRPILATPLPPIASKEIERLVAFRWIIFLYTPKGINWISQLFDDACCISEGGALPDNGVSQKLYPNYWASRVDGELSGILSQTELARMRVEMPLSLYAQEIRCSRISEEQQTLITSAMIQACNEYRLNTHYSYENQSKIVSIDPAWGGDICQMYGFVGHKVVAERAIRDKLRTSEIVLNAKLLAAEIGTRNFIIDCVNDVGIADSLSEDIAGYNVQRYKSSEKAKEGQDLPVALTFANKRAETYYYVSDLIRKKEVDVITDKELVRQLPFASRFTTQNSTGRLLIQPKEQIKKVLGCSPDKSDAYCVGLWGLQNVESEEGQSNKVYIGRPRVLI